MGRFYDTDPEGDLFFYFCLRRTSNLLVRLFQEFLGEKTS